MCGNFNLHYVGTIAKAFHSDRDDDGCRILTMCNTPIRVTNSIYKVLPHYIIRVIAEFNTLFIRKRVGGLPTLKS